MAGLKEIVLIQANAFSLREQFKYVGININITITRQLFTKFASLKYGNLDKS